MAKKKNREARNRSIVKWMWRCLALFFLAVFAVFFLIYNGFIGYMPPVAELRNPTDNFASTMYTADGVEMGKLFQSKGNRYYVEFDQISPYLRDALIAVEDERYYDHSGIDATAIGRSVVKRIIMGREAAGGGSTITLWSEAGNTGNLASLDGKDRTFATLLTGRAAHQHCHKGQQQNQSFHSLKF